MNAEFFALLEQLDRARERVCVRVAILFANRSVSSKDSLAESFLKQGGTRDYQEFLATLGWGVDTYHHRGFGNLQEAEDTLFAQGLYAPYWSDVATEMAFHVVTLMSEGDPMERRLEGALQCSCVVVWVENLDTFQPARLFEQVEGERLIITVTPLRGMLYTLHLYPSSRSVTCFSPLVNGMVVTKALVAPLIRATAKQAYEVFVTPYRPTPRNRRAALIEEIYESSRYFPTVEEYYTSLFTDPSAEMVRSPSARSGPRFKQEMDESPQERKLSQPLSAREGSSAARARSRRLSVELDRKPVSPRGIMKEDKDVKKRSHRHRKKDKKGEKRRLKRLDTSPTNLVDLASKTTEGLPHIEEKKL